MIHSQHILALDQGTTSSRSILFNTRGEIVARAQKEFPQYYPKPGWVEHDALEIWASQSATMSEILHTPGIDPKSISAIGITNQRETTVIWERATGRPVHNAIVWQDRRTASDCSRLTREGHGDLVTQKTGLRLDPYFSATKIRWLLENVKDARERAAAGDLCFGTIDTWLLWNLTKGQVHATDASNASRTLLYNLKTNEWDEELLELFEIPRAILPSIRSSSEILAGVADNLPCAGTTIAGMAGDQHAALFGQTCFEEGMVKNTYGTGCFMLMNTGDQLITSQNDLLTTVAWDIDGKIEYALEGSIFVGGAVVQWLRDEMEMVRSAEELNELAATVADSGGLLLVPAFTGLGAPHWDPYARGIAVGLTRGIKRAHFCRAALDSIAYQCADLLQAMREDSGLKATTLRVDGGSSRSDLMLQFQSDLLQVEVQRPECIETTALGAAFLAGLAVGVWKDQDEIARLWQSERSFVPQVTASEAGALKQQWNRAVERSKSWEVNG